MLKLVEDDPIRSEIVDGFRFALGPLQKAVSVYIVYVNESASADDSKPESVYGELGYMGGSLADLTESVNCGFQSETIVLKKHPAECLFTNIEEEGLFHLVIFKFFIRITEASSYSGREFVLQLPNNSCFPLFLISIGGQSLTAVHEVLRPLHLSTVSPSPRSILEALFKTCYLLLGFDTTSQPCVSCAVTKYKDGKIGANDLVQALRLDPLFDKISEIYTSYVEFLGSEEARGEWSSIVSLLHLE